LDFSDDDSLLFKNHDILEINLLVKNENFIGSINPIQNFMSSKADLLIKRIQEGINVKFKPLLVEEGVSGSYFFRDKNGKKIAIFKCIDEEPFAPNNPKGYKGNFG